MPPELKHRMRSITESIAVSQRQPPDSSADTSTLSTLSTAAHRKEGVRLCYRAASGSETVRDFDPYGLAFNAGHWYAVGYCGLRKGLRSFRLDRVRSVDSQPRQFEKPARFDVLDHLTSSIATMPRRFAVEVHLKTTLESAKRELFQAIGVLEPLGDGVLLRGQADDLQWFARELARLPWPFEMIRPAALVRALDEHARTLLKRSASSKSARSARSR
jgi:predicted DNA-binding transcriptional regulator YafY